MRTPRCLPRLTASLLTPAVRPTPSLSSTIARSPLASSARPLSLLASGRPSLSLSSFLPSLTTPAPAAPGQQGVNQVRFATYGAEYQPSQVRRKRKHGFLVRKRTRNGRKTLERRWSKGRKFLSH